MPFHLVVVRAFGTYGKGDTITDADTIARVLVGDNAASVVRVQTAAQEG